MCQRIAVGVVKEHWRRDLAQLVEGGSGAAVHAPVGAHAAVVEAAELFVVYALGVVHKLSGRCSSGRVSEF